MILERLLELPQYSLDRNSKLDILLPMILDKLDYHADNSVAFRNILLSLKYKRDDVNSFFNLPFIPVRLFKNLELKSIPDESVFKILNSSGTTSQNVSKIYLDKQTALLQTRALASIITSFIGNQRLPMVIVDYKNVLKNRNEFSARGAGILGLSNFGRDHLYVLDNEMNFDIIEFKKFLRKFAGQKILFFGFTFMIWQYLLEALDRDKISFEIPEGVLIHSGGWKKLSDRNINNTVFKTKISELLGIKRIHNFYGMVEQVGGIYMECEYDYFHVPNFSEIVIRSTEDYESIPVGKTGLVQTISVLPSSYPGNSILTEDLGIITGKDDCKCGRKGAYFSILGRIPKAELRGCSDTHAYSN